MRPAQVNDDILLVEMAEDEGSCGVVKTNNNNITISSSDYTRNGSSKSPSCCCSCSSSQNFRMELREQLRTALPALWGMVLYKIPWLISLHFVGGIGSEELAAAALAATLCNITGMSLAVGLSSALTTLTGQARGDLLSRMETQHNQHCNGETNTQEEKDNKNLNATECTLLIPNNRVDVPYDSEKGSIVQPQPILPLVYLYRGLFLQLILVIPVGLWWCIGIEPLLLALGQGQHLSQMTATYLKILTPGLWSYSINWTLTAWLQAMEMAYVPAYAAAVGLVFHIPFNILFVYTWGWGYLGVGAATVMFQILQPFCICFYLFATSQGKALLLRQMVAEAVDRRALSFWMEAKLALSYRGIWQYLGLALPGVVIVSEWWASEVAVFLAGRLVPSPDIAIGAMTIYQTINTFCFMLPIATSVAGSTRVGNLLGAGKTKEAAFASYISIVVAALVAGTMSLILWFTPHTAFPYFFTPDPGVVLETSHVIPLLAIYVFADGIQSSFNGIIKGCGRQVITMPVVVVAYWVVGVPLAYYLAFVRTGGSMSNPSFFSGVRGLVLGMTAGTWVHMILLGILVVGTINWDHEVLRAKARIRAQHGH